MSWILWAFINGHALVMINDYYATRDDCLMAAEQTKYVYAGRPAALGFACTPGGDYMKAQRKLKRDE